jgi:hypothetical protein
VSFAWGAHPQQKAAHGASSVDLGERRLRIGNLERAKDGKTGVRKKKMKAGSPTA